MPTSKLPFVPTSAKFAPAIIAIGLLALLVQAVWPAVPVMTPMAVVTLGATIATLDRYRGKIAFCGAVFVHLFLYTSLYLLFAGAVCHAATTGPQDGLSLLPGVDFSVSAMLMALVVRLCITAIAKEGHDATR